MQCLLPAQPPCRLSCGSGRALKPDGSKGDQLSKRILIIVENLPCPFDRRTWQEARTLKAAGYKVFIICPTGMGYEATEETVDDIPIYRYRLPIEADSFGGYVVEYVAAFAAQFWLSLKVARRHGFDAIHACNPPDTICVIGLVFRLFGKKFVFDHHDLNPELFRAKFGRNRVLEKLLILLERLSFRTAHISIATNESYRSIAIERGRMSPDNVFVVRSGPDLQRVTPVQENTAWKRGKRFLVGYLGVMGKQEGLDHLLNAARYIRETLGRDDIGYVLVGGGPELANLKNLATKLKVADIVTFTGRVPDAQLLDALSAADVCVNPDVANDMNDKSTMNKIMEYMALGKPIVQYDLLEGRYTAQKASLYAKRNDFCDLARLIVDLLDNRELRQEMGSFGRNRVVNELAWEFEAPKLLAAYSRLFDAPPG